MARKHREEFTVIRTDAKCSDRKYGAFLTRYLLQELSAGQAAKFEQHLLTCIACGTEVSNWRNIQAYMKTHPKRLSNLFGAPRLHAL